MTSIAWVVWALISALLARSPHQQRQRMLRALFMYSMLTLYIAMALGGAPIFWWFALVWGTAAFAWPVVRSVLVPLGAWRAAWFLGALEACRFGERGVSVLAGAWAALCCEKPPLRGLAWLERRRDALKPLGAPALLAGALISAARGDRDGARELCQSLDLVAPERCGLTVALAREWLIADAAERGEWWVAAEVSARPGPQTAAGRFVGAAARRLSGHGAPASDRELFWRWLLAPSRGQMRPLLLRARGAAAVPAAATAAGAGAPPQQAAEAPEIDPLVAALAMHASLLARPPQRVQMQDVEALGSAWDRAFSSSELRALVCERAAELGTPADPDRITQKLASDVRGELAAVARAAGHRIDLLARACGVVDGAAQLVHEQLLHELELGLRALEVRLDARRELPPFAEWREFLALRALFERAVALGGNTVRHLAFPDAHHQICELAVWLWNVREEYTIANAMFRWLLEEAIAVGDREAIELQRRNAGEI